MKLKTKILVIIAVAMFALFIAGSVVMSTVYTNFIREQEQTQFKAGSDTLWGYIQSVLSSQESNVKDWATWDDTYQFIEDANDTYIEKNLNSRSLSNNNLCFVVLLDKQAHRIFQVYYDEEKNEVISCPASLLAALDSFMARNAPYTSPASFYYCGENGCYSIAVAPVTDSLGKKAPNGYLLFGNKFDQHAITKMSGIVGGTVSIQVLDSLPDDLVSKIVSQPPMGNGMQILSEPVGNTSTDTYIMPPVSSIGSPLVIAFSRQRDIFQHGINQLHLSIAMFAISFTLVLLVLLGALNRNITQPITRLMKAVGNLQLSREKIDRLPVQGHDELTELSATINQMIGKVEQGYENAMQFGFLVSRMKQGLVVFDAVASPQGDIEAYRLAYSNDSFRKKVAPENSDTALGILAQGDPRRLERLNSVVSTGVSIIFETTAKELGKSFEVVAYRPKPMQLAAIVTDITERKLIENERQYTSYHDQLTGLYNRRYFDEALIGFDTPNFLPLSVIIGDVNGLKLTNDAFGHHTGDALLVAVAQALGTVCRKQDIIARWGGDEFIALLPRTSQKDTGVICERINKAVSQIEINSLVYSISLGYETKTVPEQSFSEVMKKAEDYMYRKKLIASHSGRGQAINAILTTFKENNPREKEHSNRVSHICRQIGRAMGYSEEQLNDLELLGLVHDVGKIAISDTIINKEARLTPQEWDELKRHPEIGYRILCSAANMQEIAEYVLYHHERWDGSGYPKAVKGPNIPIQARILSVADAFDAMTSERPYKKSLSVDAAVEEIQRMAGSQFDPQVAKVFVEMVLKRKWEQPQEKEEENAG